MKTFILCVVFLTITSFANAKIARGHPETQHHAMNTKGGYDPHFKDFNSAIKIPLDYNPISYDDLKTLLLKKSKILIAMLNDFLKGQTNDIKIDETTDLIVYTHAIVQKRFEATSSEASVLRHLEAIESNNETVYELEIKNWFVMVPAVNHDDQSCEAYQNCNEASKDMFQYIHQYIGKVHSACSGEEKLLLAHMAGIFTTGDFLVSTDVEKEFAISRFYLYDHLHHVSVYLDAFFELIEEAFEHLHQEGKEHFSIMKITENANNITIEMEFDGGYDLKKDLEILSSSKHLFVHDAKPLGRAHHGNNHNHHHHNK